MYFRRKILLVTSLFVFLQAQEVVIDINSLVEPDLDEKEHALMQQLGLDFCEQPVETLSTYQRLKHKWAARARFIAYSLAHNTPLTQETIQEEFFRHLQAATPKACGGSVPYQNTMLPTLMCNWLAQHDGGHVIETFDDYLEHHTELTPGQILFYKAVAFVAFNAQKYAQTSKLNPDTLDFIHICHQTKHPIYLIGNTNGECLAALKRRFASEFAHFDVSHCYFSHQDGFLKPEEAFYSALKKHVSMHGPDQAVCLESPATMAHVPASIRYLGSRTLVASQATLQALATELAAQPDPS